MSWSSGTTNSARSQPSGSAASRRTRSARSTSRAYGHLTSLEGGEVATVLEVPAAGLLALDRLEERLEVALAEAHRPVPLDQLEEHRRPVLHRLGEDLQQVAVLVAVGEDLQLAQLVQRHPRITDPRAELVVVGVRGVEEVHTRRAHRADRAHDVVGREGDV